MLGFIREKKNWIWYENKGQKFTIF